MSDESEVGTVLANAPRSERAFGRKLAAVITLASLYFSRRTMSAASLTSILFCFGVDTPGLAQASRLALFSWRRFAKYPGQSDIG